MVLEAGLTLFAANFMFIFLKAFQQRNVAWLNYLFVLPLSIFMAAAEFYVIHRVAELGWQWWAVLAGGLGAGLGALTAMWMHERITNSNGRHVRNA